LRWRLPLDPHGATARHRDADGGNIQASLESIGLMYQQNCRRNDMETTSHTLKQKAIEEMKKFLFIGAVPLVRV
jgi:hypothetical protein